MNDVFLVIPNVRIEDAGTYVCTAQNLRGTIQQRVNLFVKGEPLTLLYFMSKYHILIG